MPTTNERLMFLVIRSRRGVTLAFTLPDGFSDGYQNTLKAVAEPRQTHPRNYLWKQGAVKDMKFKLKLVVGISYGIESPRQLLWYVEQLYSMTILRAGQTKLEEVEVLYGAWFKRTGYIKDVDVKFAGAPVDVTTGIPMEAEVSLTITPYYPSQSPKAPYRFSKG